MRHRRLHQQRELAPGVASVTIQELAYPVFTTTGNTTTVTGNIANLCKESDRVQMCICVRSMRGRSRDPFGPNHASPATPPSHRLKCLVCRYRSLYPTPTYCPPSVCPHHSDPRQPPSGTRPMSRKLPAPPPNSGSQPHDPPLRASAGTPTMCSSSPDQNHQRDRRRRERRGRARRPCRFTEPHGPRARRSCDPSAPYRSAPGSHAGLHPASGTQRVRSLWSDRRGHAARPRAGPRPSNAYGP